MNHWKTFFFAAAAAAVTSLGLVNSSHADLNDPQAAYRALGIPQTATEEEIINAYQAKISKKGISPQARAKLSSAFALLSNPELRAQNDSGKPLEIQPDPADRERLARLLETTNPKEASRLKKYGVASVDAIANAATFYLASGVSELKHCYDTHDPSYCRAYYESLGKWDGYAGFGMFVAGSRLGSGIVTKKLGQGLGATLLSDGTGLVVGSLANEVFSDFYNLPEMQEWLKAREIKDPITRDKKVKEAQEKILNATFRNKHWYTEKAPSLISMLLAAGASQLTMGAIQTSLGAIEANATRFGKLACIAGNFNRSLKGENLKGWRKFTHKRAHEFGGLLLFMGMEHAIRPGVNAVWDATTLHPALRNSKDQLMKAAAQYKANPTKETEKHVLDEVKESAQMWEQYRHTLVGDAETTMALHAKEFQDFTLAVGKPKAFYSWFIHGFKSEGDEWDKLSKTYYPEGTTPKDIQKEAEPYLRGFFCGPDPEKAFVDSKDVHGLPDPTHLYAKVSPYRVVEKVDPSICNSSIDELKNLIKKGDYELTLMKTAGGFEFSTQEARIKRINEFESQIQTKFLKAIRGTSQDSSLPNGLLPSIEKEIENLTAVKQSVEGTDLAKRIDEKIARMVLVKEKINELKSYYSTPANERETPQDDMTSMLVALGGTDDPEWQKAYQYYNSFILK